MIIFIKIKKLAFHRTKLHVLTGIQINLYTIKCAIQLFIKFDNVYFVYRQSFDVRKWIEVYTKFFYFILSKPLALFRISDSQ
jgi:hypothetical protein